MSGEVTTVEPVAPGDEPFAVRLRQAIQDSGLSLQAIVQELRGRGTPVTIATLSYWQSGRSRPERSKSLEALAELEQVLELPGGELSSRLPQRKPRGRYARGAAEAVDTKRFIPEYGLAHRLMAELGRPWNDALTRLSIHDRLHVDRFKRARRMEHRLVLRADRDGIEGMVFVLQPDKNVTTEPLVAPVSNCSLGRVLRHKDPELLVAELTFPRPLLKDEITMIEFEVRTPTGGTPTEGESRAFRTPTREFVMETVFDPRALPYRVQATTAKDASGAEVRGIRDVAVHDGLAQLLVLDVTPGYHGMRFAWTEVEAKGWDA